MEQLAEFLSARGQTPITDAADRRCVVRPDRHRQLHTGAVPAFGAQLTSPPTQQAGDDTFDHRTTVAGSVAKFKWG